MKRKLSLKHLVFVLFVCVGFLLSFTIQANAENIPITKANYKLAERFSGNQLRKMVFSQSVSPHWLKLSERFWYVYETSEGKTFYMVDPAKRTKKPIFDSVKMAALLSNITKDPYDAQHLPVGTIKFIKNEKVIYFKVSKNEDVLAAEKRQAEWEKKDEEKDKEKDKEKNEVKDEDKDKEKKKKEKSEIEKAEEAAKKFHHFEYELATGKLTMLENFVDEPNRASWASISPDKETIIFGRNFNLYSMSKTDYEKWLNNPDDETIEEVQLTTDGKEYYSYHRGGRGENNVTKEKDKDKRKSAYVMWSHDSKKFATTRTDSREVKDLWVINSVSDPRPTLETYKYHMPGEEEAPQVKALVYDLEKKEMVKIEADAFKDQTLSLFSYPYPVNTRDDRFRASKWLSESPDKLYFSRTSRDLKRIDICVADTSTGEVTVLIEERLNTYVETRRLGFVNNGQELIHWSERDGWAHFYLYDGDGNLKKQMTSGPFHCENIVSIDEKNRVLYFTANGREKGEDPYYLHLYRANFDGTGLKLLNKDNFNHSVSSSDSSRYFIDYFSRVDTTPVSLLRDSSGNKDKNGPSRLFRTSV